MKTRPFLGRRGASHPVWFRPVAELIVCLALWVAGGQSTFAADERALLDLWLRHIGTRDDHASWVAACRSFATARPNDPLVPVVHGIASWHLFKAGKTAEAVAVIEPYLSPSEGEIAYGASLLARAWTTRLDRDRVVEALQAYYRHEVRYPERLEALPAHPRIPASLHPPLADRWGYPWSYRLTGYPGVPGFLDQRYSLTSSLVGGVSDFEEALRIPYADRIRWVPTRVSSRRDGDLQVVQFMPVPPGGAEGKVAMVSVGGEAEGLYLAHVGPLIVVVCDRLHWKVFRRPGS